MVEKISEKDLVREQLQNMSPDSVTKQLGLDESAANIISASMQQMVHAKLLESTIVNSLNI